MYRRGDPRWNRTIQHISENLEHANETAAENLYGFTQSYVNPCLASVTRCCNAVTAPCFPSTSDRRRHRARSRGRAELSFDFYDDWDDDEGDGLLGWGHDSLERFLGTSSYGSNYGTSYGTTQQPPAARPMAYAARARDPRFDARRKSTGAPHTAPDPTLIPSSSYFGFLARLPFNLGRKGLRYKPSAADLTEHPGARHAPEAQPLIEDSDEDPPRASASDPKTHRRARSNTLTSRHTTSSLSSRGDIFPSEDELDDAVPLDDEFAFVLERRATGDESDAKTERSRSARSTSLAGSARTSSDHRIEMLAREAVPELAELRGEEERLRREEEGEVRRRRARARDLAVRKGLAVEGDAKTDTTPGDVVLDAKTDTTTPLSDTALDAVLDEGRPGSPEERPVTAVRREAQNENLEDGQKEDEDQGQGDAFVPARLPHFG
ncbi:hypothetical protein C7974DRAFT_429116 [Boeremia exigua]|uniref:uncharacterized protein n=1 Tax=Boeremia exigua TaxID=749465 RepID=UPI001E8E0FEC|nr:uncharacterized protein C7974DRAFT_429116 [Boeremia exigua]KAH6612634.1 hypothetical protein C7974DRAFT_429116 [Boeremia exigua]